MASRGPDGAGEWYSAGGHIGLAHRRLAIIDLSDHASQPMTTPDQRLAITFNGEIYNYRELRRHLTAKGHVFVSNSDTEVLLYLYREHGREMLQFLRGMYAFAVWDEEKRSLFLARDPLGIKPLYYADDGQTLRVASQVKALLAGNGIDAAPEPAGHVGFFLWGHVPEPFTLYRGIRALPAGAAMWAAEGKQPQIVTTFSVTQLLTEAEAHFANTGRGTPNEEEHNHEQLAQSIRDSVCAHLVSDVPVGVFLSAGIDSTTLAGLVAEAGGDLRTITLGFREYEGSPHDEVPPAEEVARHYGAQHSTVWVTKEDFEEELPRLLAAMDQPSIDGANTYFVARAASSCGLKVALSGVGGDELFAGYSHFKNIPRVVNTLRWTRRFRLAAKTFRIVSLPILKQLTSPKYAGIFEYGNTFEGAYLLRRGLFMPWELPEILDGEMVREGWRALQPVAQLEMTHDAIQSERLKITALELTWYLRNQLLRDADWASMAHSLEVRTPLVDWRLLSDLAPLLVNAHAPAKADLATLPQKSLPEAVRTRTKTGFSVPVREWMLATAGTHKRGLRGWARALYRYFGNGKRAMVLMGDAYGGHGGIAKFNRDLLGGMAAHPHYREIAAFPRVTYEPIVEPPSAKLSWHAEGLGGRTRYVIHLWRVLARDRRFDLVVCGHINLLPLAWVARTATNAPLVLIVHGVEAWQPHERTLVNWLTRKADYVVAVSNTTKERFVAWSGFPAEHVFILPNCVDMNRFHPRPRNLELVTRYGLSGRKVLMTLARLANTEQYKGIDQILEIMPALIAQIPDLTYLVVGDGDDRDRLAKKAEALALNGYVIFTGRIPEQEKVDHYNLADAFAMPGTGEGFGIAYLEAMACGVPTIGSVLDGSRDALLNGRLGVLVDPRDPNDVQRGIVQALDKPRGVPPGLERFSYPSYEKQLKGILDRFALGRRAAPSP
jgi:asparagine synthase (glutamine-hydrolysing)